MKRAVLPLLILLALTGALLQLSAQTVASAHDGTVITGFSVRTSPGGYGPVYSHNESGMVPLYRCYGKSGVFFSTQKDCNKQGKNIGTVGYVKPKEPTTATPQQNNTPQPQEQPPEEPQSQEEPPEEQEEDEQSPEEQDTPPQQTEMNETNDVPPHQIDCSGRVYDDVDDVYVELGEKCFEDGYRNFEILFGAFNESEPDVHHEDCVDENNDLLRYGVRCTDEAPPEEPLDTPPSSPEGTSGPGGSDTPPLIPGEEITGETPQAPPPEQPTQVESPAFSGRVPRFTFGILLGLGLLYILLRLLALDQRIQDLLLNLFGMFYKVPIATEEGLRQMMRTHTLSDFLRVYVTPETRLKYATIKNIKAIPKSTVKDRDAILALSREFRLDLDTARLLRFAATRTRARFLGIKSMPEELKKRYLHVNFYNLLEMEQKRKGQAGIRKK